MLLSGSLLLNSLKLFGLVILFFIILVACYYVTRFVGARKLGAMKDSYIKVIDVHRINQTQCLMIVQVGRRYFLLSGGKDAISFLSELKEEELTKILPDVRQPLNFTEVFASALKKTKPDESSKEPDDNHF